MAIVINSVIPKTSVSRVIAVASAVGSRSKGLTRDAIARKLNVKAGTGSANNRVIAAKKYGVIEVARTGGYVLTELGRRLAVAEPERADIVAAIRHVAPFAKLIDAAGGNPGLLSEDEVRAGLQAAGVIQTELEDATRVFIASWNHLLPDAPAAAAGRTDDAASETVEIDDSAPDGSEPPPREAETSAFRDQQMVRWVLEQAPAVGEAWPKERYEAWSELLRSTIHFLYPDTASPGG